MRYRIFQIEPHVSYGITIGSRIKPDSEFREQVVSQIDRAMSSFERDRGQTHKVAIVPDWELDGSSESGLPSGIGFPGIPYLYPGKQYLMFALLYSEPSSKESLSNSELEFYRKEVEGMISGFTNSVRAALVLLQDCSVNVLESLWNEERNSTEYRVMRRHGLG